MGLVRSSGVLLVGFAGLAAGCGPAVPRFTSAVPAVESSVQPPAGTHALAGVASYYADDFNGRTTANGEVYDMYGMTAAHKTLPFNTRLRVTNLNNGMAVEVRINDRGPFKEGRVIDLSLAAAQRLGMIGPGTASVQLEILEWGKP
jgi:rare lipoprotein A